MKMPFLVFVAMVSVGAAVLGRAGEPLKLDSSGRYAEGELLVKFASAPEGAAAAKAHRAVGSKTLRQFRACGWQLVELPPGLTVEEGLTKFKHSPAVLAVEPNYVVRVIEPVPTPPPDFDASSTESSGATPVTPNDPMFPSQWGLARIRAPEAWTTTTGNSNVVVAVIGDTGVNYRHEDLWANMWRNPGEIPGNAIDDDGNGYVDDVHGWDAVGEDGDPMDEGINGVPSNYRYHGTACAGIIGAVGNNGRGLAGVNWSVELMVVRGTGTDNLTLITDTIEGFEYVILMKRRGVNIRATSNSYYSDPNVYSQALRDAIDAAGNEGILHVFAAANDGRDIDVNPRYPAAYNSPSIVSVAASAMNDNLPSFSNWGRTNVDLAAPGESIVTVSGATTNGYISNFGQTSGATPFVAGAVALLAAANPTATAADIKTALLETVDVLPAFTNKMVSNGRLNVARAMERLGRNVPPAFFAPLEDRTVPVAFTTTFTAEVGGSRPLRYQWRFNGSAIPEATNSTFSVTNVSFSNRGDYSVAVSNAFGAVTSTPAVLTVVPLLITIQPQGAYVRPGSNAMFSIALTSTVPVTCQWSFNGTPLTGATGLALTITDAQLANEGDYAVAVANAYGSVVSSNAPLSILIDPLITVAPVSQAVVVGGNATFSVAFTGNPQPFGVEWRRGSTVLSSNTVYGTQHFYNLTNAQSRDAATWRVVVRNVARNIASGENRTFTIAILPDADGDGLPDAWELAHGLSTNDLADAVLDLDGDGLSNLAEYWAGTNPTEAASTLRLDSMEVSDGLTRLQFLACSNRTYTVLGAASPENGSWHRVVDIVAAPTNRLMEVVEPFAPTNAPHYFRVITPRVP